MAYQTMTTTQTMPSAGRKSYILSVEPVDYSLTAGSTLATAPASPPYSPTDRPPTPLRGPLNSHPTTPDDLLPGAWPPSPEPETSMPAYTSTPSVQHKPSVDNFRTPITPASRSNSTHQHLHLTPPSSDEPPNSFQRRPSAVRKLLSLSNLRSSFSSSRTSLILPRTSVDWSSGSRPEISAPINVLKRPCSPGGTSSAPPIELDIGPPLNPQHAQPQPAPRTILRSKRSSSWFKRKSSLFSLSGHEDDGEELDAVHEAPQQYSGMGSLRPDTRESKRLKESPIIREPAPSLPELGLLAGERMGSGDLGWDEDSFGR